MRGLKAIRQARGVSRQELADAIGVSYGSVKAWELGYREAGIDKAAACAKVLGCSVQELVGEAPTPVEAITRAFMALDATDRAKVLAFIAGLQAAKR